MTRKRDGKITRRGRHFHETGTTFSRGVGDVFTSFFDKTQIDKTRIGKIRIDKTRIDKTRIDNTRIDKTEFVSFCLSWLISHRVVSAQMHPNLSRILSESNSNCKKLILVRKTNSESVRMHLNSFSEFSDIIRKCPNFPKSSESVRNHPNASESI